MNAKEFANLLIKNELATNEELIGCSEKEFQQLEEHIGFKFPQSYKEFLTFMGHRAGIFERGTNYLYKDLFNLTRDTKEILMGGPFKLPDDALSSHHIKGVSLHISDYPMATTRRSIPIR